MANKIMLIFRPYIQRVLQPTRQFSVKPAQIWFSTSNFIYSQDDNPTMGGGTPKRFSLSFEEYQKLKRELRTKQRVAGIPFGFGAITTCSFAMAYLHPDMFDATPESVTLIMGLDPLVVSGISGVVSGAVGYVAGVNIFKWIWSKLNKEKARNLYERDTDFLNRLDKFRFGEDSKFEDDYYGESIKTLSDYRQWIRTHQRKRETSEKFKIKQLNMGGEEKIS